MATKQKRDPNNALHDTGLMVEEFRAIEMLREHLESVGWTSDYRQLESGQLRAHLAIRETSDIALVRMELSHNVVGQCRSADDSFTIVMSVSKNVLRVNGHSLDQGGLLIIPPKTDVHVISDGSGSSTLGVVISVGMLARYIETLCDDHSLAEIDKMTLIELPKTQLAQFRRLVAGAILQPLDPQTLAAEKSDIAAKLSRLLVRPDTVKKAGDPYHRLAKYRVVQRAEEYVHENSAGHIRITNLCEYCGVSLSTLERIFARELGISPSSYIRATRLHEVRRKLLHGYPENVTIADIAMSCGFMHMGRFSHRYRAHFGRLPSEDRRLAANSSRRKSSTVIPRRRGNHTTFCQSGVEI